MNGLFSVTVTTIFVVVGLVDTPAQAPTVRVPDDNALLHRYRAVVPSENIHLMQSKPDGQHIAPVSDAVKGKS